MVLRTLHLEFARIALRELRKRFLNMLIVQGKDKRKHIVSYCTIYSYINQLINNTGLTDRYIATDNAQTSKSLKVLINKKCTLIYCDIIFF